MSVIVWLVEGTWPACVDTARLHAPEDAEIVLLHVTGHEIPDAAHGAFTGPLGLDELEHDSGARPETPAASGRHLLESAADRLGCPCTRMQRTGRIEREVVVAAQGAQLLIVARDGDRSRLGPNSLGPAGRFVVDHAPCPVLLVWPEPAPGLAGIPALSPGPQGHGRPGTICPSPAAER